MNRSFQNRVASWFAAAAAILVVVALVSYHSFAGLVADAAWVEHTHKVLGSLDGVIHAVTVAEDSQRSYLLTGQGDSLGEFNANLIMVEDSVTGLRRLIADNPDQQRRLDRLEADIRERVRIMQKVADLERTHGPAAARAALDPGHNAMIKVMASAQAMRDTEQQLLRERSARTQASVRRATLTSAIGIGFSFIILATVYHLINQEISQRRRAEGELREASALVELLQKVTSAANEAATVETAIQTCLDEICSYAHWPVGHAYLMTHHSTPVLQPTSLWHLPDAERFAEFRSATARTSVVPGYGLPGQVLASGQPEWHADIQQTLPSPRMEQANRAGLHAAFGFPILIGAEIVGVLEFFSTETVSPDQRLLQVLAPIGVQLGRVVERRRAALTLARHTQELTRSNQELEQFAYVASHDLQEPLRMVASYTQLLSKRYKGKLDASADEFIGYAVDGATRMQQLINDLLTYSRVGTRGLDLTCTDCEAIFERAVTNLRGAIEDSGAIVTHDPLPEVMGDSTQLGQLFQNLIGNAIKFHGPETPCVHVTAKTVPAESGGTEWRFSVRDNGIGISPEYADRIFVIFQRLHTRTQYPGTGIGLALCKKIVERHGGRIWLESEPGQGTTFLFTLPQCDTTQT